MNSKKLKKLIAFKGLLIIGLLLFSRLAYAEIGDEQYVPTRNQWLEVEIKSVTNGYTSFRTSVQVRGDGVSLNVNYDDIRDKEKAIAHGGRMVTQATWIASKYSWADDYRIFSAAFLGVDSEQSER